MVLGYLLFINLDWITSNFFRTFCFDREFNKSNTCNYVLRNISNTRDSASLGHANTKKRVENMMCGKIWGVWIADETLSRAFDISSQLKQKLRSKRRSKIVKIYAN